MNTRYTSRRPVVAGMIFASLLFIAIPFSPPAPAQRATGQAQSRGTAHYSCPMHPEVTSQAPGKCSKCGMNLLSARDEKAGATSDHSAPVAGGQTATAGTSARTAQGAAMSIPDIEVLDQDGRRLRFYTDLVKGKTVAINFMFTTCTTICPPLAATFARIQRDLGGRAGRDVQLISVSVDPATDTPARMKSYLAKFRAAEGWVFVTGDKTQINTLLKALGAYTSRPEEHTPSVIIGNDATGQWTRAYGLAKPSQLVQLISAATEGRLEPTPQEAKQP